MSDISPSAITTDAAFEKEVAGADFETIKSLMAQRAVDLKLVERDRYDPAVLLPVAPGTNPRQFAQTITDAKGQKLFFYGATELELEQNVGAYFRSVATAQPAAAATTTTTTTEQPRGTDGRFLSAAETAAETEKQAALSLRLQLGQITTAEYLAQSGAIDSYLAKQGIDVEDLKASSQEKRDAAATASWESATASFIANHPEWQGGDANRDLLGKLLVDNNLVDSADKLGAMEACYNHAVENGMLTENPEVTAHQKISEATSVEAIREALNRPTTSGLFGR